jgi:outer membrane protein OmpA-like peptidoglycan-associated protein
MKKIIFTIAILICSFHLFGQEKGSYITLSGGLGPTGFQYKPTEINEGGYSDQKARGHATLGYSYFFTKKIGISTGVGISYYSTIGGYDKKLTNEDYYQFENIQTDDYNGDYYYLRVRLGNWEEQQKLLMIEIPLMIMFQHKFGKYQRHGIYLGLGAKFQIPVKYTYSVIDGEKADDYRLNVSGYYPEYSGSNAGTTLDFGAPENDAHFPVDHGFGSINNPNEKLDWAGKMNVRFNVAGTVEAGFLFGLGRRVDLNIGAYLDYGFMNIKKGESKNLIEAPSQYQPDANGNIGYGITYNGLVNSKQVDRVNTISYGGKIGIRIKLGKLEIPSRAEVEEKERLRQERDSLLWEQQMEFNDMMLKSNRKLQKGVDEILTWKDMVDERLNAPIIVVEEKEEYPYGMSKQEYDILSGEHTYFTLNSSELRLSQKSLLDKKIEIMKKYPQVRIQVIGNTCDLGSAVVNGNLGLFRAKAVRDYMISKGISESRIFITTQSYNDPLLPNTSEENRSHNRRCDYEVMHEK